MQRTFLVVMRVELPIKAEFAKILFNSDLNIHYKNAIVFAVDEQEAQHKVMNAHLYEYGLNKLADDAVVTFNITEIEQDVTWIK